MFLSNVRNSSHALNVCSNPKFRICLVQSPETAAQRLAGDSGCIAKLTTCILGTKSSKQQHMLTHIYHHQPSLIIINHHQAKSTIINHHQPSSTIINHHQPSSTHNHQPTTSDYDHHPATYLNCCPITLIETSLVSRVVSRFSPWLAVSQ